MTDLEKVRDGLSILIEAGANKICILKNSYRLSVWNTRSNKPPNYGIKLNKTALNHLSKSGWIVSVDGFWYSVNL